MYTVFIKSNFDPEITAYKVNNREEGERFLQKNWEDQYNAALADMIVPDTNEEGGYYVASNFDDEYTYHEDDYASIRFKDGDQIEWFLTELRDI